MTCTILLVRHAAHDGLGDRLTGRTPGVSLGKIGRDQAQRLSQRIRSVRPARIIASPQPRTQETAHAIASACGLPAVQTDGRLDEIDFGDTWTNRTWDELDQDPAWRTWNEQRATARTPGGETM
ncbi:MAG TPA: histidine phosphatase family protein, partial [Tianweitania sediminis]|nr:histidine phosphatase family protein [Tianweitania sediminis]